MTLPPTIQEIEDDEDNEFLVADLWPHFPYCQRLSTSL